jgi:hypothetical protein
MFTLFPTNSPQQFPREREREGGIGKERKGEEAMEGYVGIVRGSEGEGVGGREREREGEGGRGREREGDGGSGRERER